MEKENNVTSISIAVKHEDGSVDTIEGKYLLGAVLLNGEESEKGPAVCVLECGKYTRLERGIIHEQMAEKIDGKAIMLSHIAREFGLYGKKEEVNKDGNIQSSEQQESEKPQA